MNDIVLDKSDSKIDLDQESLLNFLDHTVLLITQAQTAEEIDLLMDDFMADDIIDIFKNNNGLFSLINAIWLNTFKRIFVDQRAESFPLKVLWLPILFNKLGWEIEDIETFENANIQFRNQNQNPSDLYKHLVELFLNGLKFNPHVCFDLFKQRINSLNLSEADQDNIAAMIHEIEELGW